MKVSIFILLACGLLACGSVFGQNEYQQQLISEINTLAARIESHPSVELYVQRSGAIFLLNSVSEHQTWVPFAIGDAINDINSAIALSPRDPLLYSLRAEYKRDINRDYAGAVSDMDKAIELDPDNPEWYLQRANYRNLSFGCMDYRQCAIMGDKRCREIVQEACGGMAPL